MYVLGFDIGGTKCAVTTARWENGAVTLLKKAVCPTDLSVSPRTMMEKLMEMADGILTEPPVSVGISCGGPLDSNTGVILGPPNLPGWDEVPIVEWLREHYGVTVNLQNDANACAVAEWKFGAGRGCNNLAFLTFGTGLGAGLILNGQLYGGTNGNAGEVGHIRLNDNGPSGYGKVGSFEGFCSGGGLAQLGWSVAQDAIASGKSVAYCGDGATPDDVTAKTIAEAAYAGDPTALEVYRICGEYLGKGLSILMDVLNPEKIILGSIFVRSRDLLWPAASEVINREALEAAVACCRVVPAELGEHIGDYAAIAAAVL
ncbi:MAG: ROK family protein [Clostridia bacterium]|nr:ROK family protein [Clostridia bacterium]